MTEADKNRLRITAAISAMQGILESGSLGTALEVAPKIVAKLSIRMADALINELDNKDKNE
ncbi:hypothetical protein [Methanosphaera sp.]|uniref:hypothetical protein n=1 Tax=Methanosphaera sp. TaxID=2666342 RepID=UPI0025E4DCE3|nr:hypothetical protein [Methanosphaera sp.]